MRSKANMWMLSATVMLGFSGCGGDQKGDLRTFDKVKDAAPEAEHGHHGHEGHAHGPHDGELVELGEEEFHAEVAFDEENHKIVLYVLGPDAKANVAIEAQELTLEIPGKDSPAAHLMTAAPQEGDGEGKSSRFEIKSQDVFNAFHDDPKTVGKVKLNIGGKEFTAEVKHVH